VARVAQRLPVVFIPEENRIATVWDDVIDALTRRDASALLTHLAQWMTTTEVSGSAQPFVGIALLLTCAASSIV
jgi:hypothetical protein